jgi:MoxR-like ATPase
MARLSMGYPDIEAELEVVRARDRVDPITQIHPVASTQLVRDVVARCRMVHASDAVVQYAVEIIRATRQSQALRLGASPRAAIQLIAAAKALAATHGRGYVLPDDVDALAVPVLSHRLLPAVPTRGQDTSAQMAELIDQVVASVSVPLPLG